MLKHLKLADFFTLGNLWCGALAIVFSASGKFWYAGILLLIALVFDVLDGKVARWMDQANSFGKELDSLADVVSFGVAPGVLYLSVGSGGLLGYLVFIFFIACGALRLARYNISKKEGFQGLPITNSAWISVLMLALVGKYPGAYPVWTAVMVVAGLFMVSSISFKRVV